MPTSVPLGEATLASFALVMARVGGVVSMAPVPGWRRAPVTIRIVLAVGLSLVMLPGWPLLQGGEGGRMRLEWWWLGSELLLGLTAGVALAWMTEVFGFAMQVVGLQAGYSYASTIDPTTQADSGVLGVVAQLGAGLLFVSAGFDRELIRIFSESLTAYPPGAYRIRADIVQDLVRWTSAALELGLRLALPAVGLLFFVDLALAVVGRLQMQLQLLTVAFPVKMLAAMLMLGVMAASFPAFTERAAEKSFGLVRGAVARAPR